MTRHVQKVLAVGRRHAMMSPRSPSEGIAVRRFNPLTTFAVVILSYAPVLAQAPVSKPLPPAKAAAVDQAVAAELQRQGLVGVALGVLQNGEIVYLKGYGHADREQQTPVTTQTIFNWASNSKPLAAVAAMQLAEKKQLDIDANVRKYVPEFPENGAVITSRHILAHQSGIPHYTNGKIVPTKRTYDTARPFLDPVLALDTFKQSPLIFKPGEKVAYSSYAYILLSAAIQGAGQEKFVTQVDTRIAKPLKMASLQLDVETAMQPHWAAGYVKDQAGQVVRAREQAHYWKHGGGAFKSDIGDFARWGQALLNRKLVSEETEKLMWTPQTLSDGSKTTWGLGFTIEDQGGLKVSHGGKQDETTTRLVLYPKARHGMVVMCNCGFGDVGAISTAVYKALSQK
jgi:CubicO group peptidase (beta-lactamase class C family)